MSAQLWVRKFTREAGPDVAVVGTPVFIKQEFASDFFGTWLQQGENAKIHTHDELLRVFYRE